MDLYPAAPVFDVDSQTGFMPPSEPLSRLPTSWELWEVTLDAAIHGQLQLGDKIGLTMEEKAESERWRVRVKLVCLILSSRIHKAPTRIDE